eukprot:14819023-Heterocapsa_arctica.AAC.1
MTPGPATKSTGRKEPASPLGSAAARPVAVAETRPFASPPNIQLGNLSFPAAARWTSVIMKGQPRAPSEASSQGAQGPRLKGKEHIGPCAVANRRVRGAMARAP